MVSGLIDQGYKDYAVEAAISKVFATDCLWRVVDESLQIAGGNGFMREYPYERLMRDCRVNRIFEGTNDILHLFIALTAMLDAGKQLSEVAKSLTNPVKGFGVLVDYSKKVAAGAGIGSDKITKARPELKKYSEQFGEHVRLLTATVDRLLRKHGKNIADKQFATKRLAMIMIDMFALACTISRVSHSIETKGVKGAQKEIDILEVFARQVQGRVTKNYNKIDNNDDELIKGLSDFAVENERYVFDNI